AVSEQRRQCTTMSIAERRRSTNECALPSGSGALHVPRSSSDCMDGSESLGVVIGIAELEPPLFDVELGDHESALHGVGRRPVTLVVTIPRKRTQGAGADPHRVKKLKHR